jgi:hypothetical protein
MVRTRRVVLDVLKPHEPTVPTLAERVASTTGVDGVTVRLVEIDREVENVTVTVEGDDVDFGALTDDIEALGASVHSIDEFACGERVVEGGDAT